jgi:hypothetical protein
MLYQGNGEIEFNATATDAASGGAGGFVGPNPNTPVVLGNIGLTFP